MELAQLECCGARLRPANTPCGLWHHRDVYGRKNQKHSAPAAGRYAINPAMVTASSKSVRLRRTRVALHVAICSPRRIGLDEDPTSCMGGTGQSSKLAGCPGPLVFPDRENEVLVQVLDIEIGRFVTLEEHSGRGPVVRAKQDLRWERSDCEIRVTPVQQLIGACT